MGIINLKRTTKCREGSKKGDTKNAAYMQSLLLLSYK